MANKSRLVTLKRPVVVALTLNNGVEYTGSMNVFKARYEEHPDSLVLMATSVGRTKPGGMVDWYWETDTDHEYVVVKVPVSLVEAEQELY